MTTDWRGSLTHHTTFRFMLADAPPGSFFLLPVSIHRFCIARACSDVKTVFMALSPLPFRPNRIRHRARFPEIGMKDVTLTKTRTIYSSTCAA